MSAVCGFGGGGGGARSYREKECDDEYDGSLFGGRSSLGKSVSAARHRDRSSVTTGHPRVEHLASAAVLFANIPVNASGATVIKLPDDFIGVTFVMLSSDWSCEWQILNPKSSSPASLPSLLQRQLCLTQPFPPQSHMALQVSFAQCRIL